MIDSPYPKYASNSFTLLGKQVTWSLFQSHWVNYKLSDNFGSFKQKTKIEQKIGSCQRPRKHRRKGLGHQKISKSRTFHFIRLKLSNCDCQLLLKTCSRAEPLLMLLSEYFMITENLQKNFLRVKIQCQNAFFWRPNRSFYVFFLWKEIS